MGSREEKRTSSATEARCPKRSDTALQRRRSATVCSASHQSFAQPAQCSEAQAASHV